MYGAKKRQSLSGLVWAHLTKNAIATVSEFGISTHVVETQERVGTSGRKSAVVPLSGRLASW